MMPVPVIILFSISIFILGFEAGKNIGYSKAKQAFITMVKAFADMNEKENKNE